MPLGRPRFGSWRLSGCRHERVPDPCQTIVGAAAHGLVALSVATTGFWAYGLLLLKILFGTQPLVSGYILAGEAVAWSLATMAVSKAPVSADRWLIRVGAALVAAGAAGFAIAVPAGALAGIVLCTLLQGLGFGLCWPSIVHRMARFSDETERPLAVTSPETMQRTAMQWERRRSASPPSCRHCWGLRKGGG